MSELTDIQDSIIEGQAEAEAAHALRLRLRWRTKPGTQKRERDIARRLRAIDAAMKPIRSHIGRIVWHPMPDDLELALRETSRALQAERKQLKKLRRSDYVEPGPEPVDVAATLRLVEDDIGPVA